MKPHEFTIDYAIVGTSEEIKEVTQRLSSLVFSLPEKQKNDISELVYDLCRHCIKAGMLKSASMIQKEIMNDL